MHAQVKKLAKFDQNYMKKLKMESNLDIQFFASFMLN